MKIAVLSGAYKNAGDYLITKRTVELLEYCLNDVEVKIFLRKDMNRRYNEINDCDFIVFSGGPIFMPSLISYLPIIKAKRWFPKVLNKIYLNHKKWYSKKMIVLGGGWYGSYTDENYVNNYNFDTITLEFWKHVSNTGYGLSCRDWYTENVLRNSGFEKIYMTGCPAWYFLPKVNEVNFNKDIRGGVKKIIISDPANIENDCLAISLIKYLREKYDDSELNILFHRGVSEQRLLVKYAEENKIDYIDISGNCNGLSLYDDVDLHAGFRVHAHLYTLSVRNRSILIEEDGRGTGANEALGLPSIKAYSNFVHKCSHQKIDSAYLINSDVISEFSKYLIEQEISDFDRIKNAFKIQKETFNEMEKYIKLFDEIDSKTS